MKIAEQTLRLGIAEFTTRLVGSIQNTTYKWLVGGISGLDLLNDGKLLKAMQMFKDNDGLYDTAQMKAFFDNAFKASDGRLSFTLFGNQDSLISTILPPLKLSFTQADADEFIQLLERCPAVIEN